MLKVVIEEINKVLEPLNYFQKVLGIAESVWDGNGKKQPKIYCSDGQFKGINLDHKNGLSYWKKRSDATVATRASDLVACIDDYIFQYPLSLICSIPRKKLITDDSYSEDSAATTILKVLDNADLKTALNAKNVDVNPNGYTTNNITILNEEYSSIDNLNYNLAYFRINVTVVVQIRQDCIPEDCNG